MFSSKHKMFSTLLGEILSPPRFMIISFEEIDTESLLIKEILSE